MLTPADYGVIAMVTAITSFAGLFRDLGLSSAAIQKKDLTSGQQTNLFWLNVAMGAALTTIVATCSPLVSWFYGKPELTAVTIALSFNFLIGSFGAQHGAMLVRNMQFGRKAVAGITAGVASLIVAVAMAINGYSYWALVASSLTGSAVGTILLFLLSPFWPGLPRRGRGISQMFAFGAHVTTFDLVNYFHRNLDNILIGKFWGTELLGYYSKAYALLLFPIHAIRGPVYAVAFPALSRLQGNPDSLRRYYIRINGVVAQLTMPIVAALFVSSDVVIELTLGSQWKSCSEVFSILALTAFIQPTAGLRGLLMMANDHTRNYLIWGIANASFVSVGFLIAVPWGINAVAMSLAICNYLLLVPSLSLAYQGTTIRLKDFLDSTWRPAVSSLVAGAAALQVRSLLIGSSCAVSLAWLLIAFAVVNFATHAVLPGGFKELSRLVSLAADFKPLKQALAA
jgi:polysaccharide transporter, PST family